MATQRIRAATRLHLLATRQVQSAGEGDHADGGGLLLRVRGESSSWVFRFTSPSGRRREMGLGVCHRGSPQQAGASLSAARDDAHKAREQLRQGIDPIAARDGQREAAKQAEQAIKVEHARQRWTLARAARDYHERVIEPSRTPKHAATWISSLENHMPPELWNAPIDTIEPPALLSALLDVKPHERARAHKGDTLPETVQRIRQRLDSIFEDAIFHKRATSNPAAAIRRKMREATPRRDRGEFRALSYKEAPAFMAKLRAAEGVAARCLEFAVLTAARTSEALLAEWGEFDLDAGTWVVPAARMKAKEAHAVYLSPRALEVVKSMQGVDKRFVFPTTMPGRQGKPMSNMAMLVTLGRLGYRDRTTVHGLARATFSTWANEVNAARPDVIEACLAHEEGNRVRAAYNRATFNADRKALLEAWAEFLARPAAPVIELDSKRA
jgi:integrase